MTRCRQSHGFQTEHEFWAEFGHVYADVESTVHPDQRFAFATRVDGHLAEMGLASWSVMSRLVLAGSGQGQPPAIL